MLVEVIVTNLEEAIKAEKYGANRLELIDSFTDGGLSPQLELTREVCDSVSIPVNVMVRPHGRNFVYDHDEFYSIKKEIDYIVNNTKANDIVYGSLNQNGEINCLQLEQVLKQLSGTQVGVTFHRAIDVSNNVIKSFNELQNYISYGLKRVLSSGGMECAWDGRENLHTMQQLARDSGLILLAASGIKPNNASDIIKATGVSEIHLGTGLRYNNQLQESLFADLARSICLLTNY